MCLGHVFAVGVFHKECWALIAFNIIEIKPEIDLTVAAVMIRLGKQCVVGVIDIVSLAGAPTTAHALFALTQAADVEGPFTYDILDEILSNVEEVDASTFDINSDGFPDNPFVDLGSGEFFRGTVLVGGGVTL